ncbi:solute carrier family 49 member 4-like [Watersipora subatra]|uniref:solute carrier family 49 member 4-like n=1 Tax=Watersipora subatra TaxID=2589382 RepID=UPI00355C63A7
MAAAKDPSRGTAPQLSDNFITANPPLLAEKAASTETSPLLPGQKEPHAIHYTHFRVYKRRWYMLVVFCLLAFSQGLLWNTWSPLSGTMDIVFGWEPSFLALSLAVSNISITLFAFPFMYFAETKGLRFVVVVAASVLALGTALWNISLPTDMNWMIMLSSICTGLPNCIFLAGAPLLSVLWFPVNERTTATALATISTYMGVGFSFVCGPLVSSGSVMESDVRNRDNITLETIENLSDGVYRVIYIETALAALCFILVLAYFPNKPPTPPSAAQTIERIDYWGGIKLLLKNYYLWILTLAFNIASGTYNAYIPLISVNFAASLQMDQITAAMAGFASICAGCFGSIGVAAFVDRHPRHTKLVLQIMCFTAIALFTVLSCIQEGYIVIKGCTAETATVYILSMAIAVCMIGGIPLYYELGCELAFPVYEGLCGTFITVINDLIGLAFYALFLIPSLAHSGAWMTWACLAACSISFPLLFFVKESYTRLNLEIEESDRQSGERNQSET